MATTESQGPQRKVVFLDTGLNPIPPGSMVIGRLAMDPLGTIPGSGRIGRKQVTIFIHPSGEGWVGDLASTNGTTLNGRRLPPGVLVKLDLSQGNTIVAAGVSEVPIGIKPLKYTFPAGVDRKIFAVMSTVDRRRLPIPVGVSMEDFLAGVDDTDYYWIVIGGNGQPIDVAFTIANLNRTAEHKIGRASCRERV